MPQNQHRALRKMAFLAETPTVWKQMFQCAAFEGGMGCEIWYFVV